MNDPLRAITPGGSILRAVLADDPFVHILAQARAVVRNESRIATLSIDERIAVALVLDRSDLLEDRTLLESIELLGPQWTRAALHVQRAGVTCEELAHA